MKKLIYKYPVTCAILLNTITSVIVISSINSDLYFLVPIIFVSIYLNNIITDIEVRLSKFKLISIILSVFCMILTSLLSNKYILPMIKS